MNRSLAAAVLGSTLAIPSLASAQMPQYDVAAHCEEIAGFTGTYSNSLYNTCVDSEQRAYDALKPRWSEISRPVRDHCNEIATFTGTGSYSLLSTCVDSEEAAGSSRKTFRY